MKMPIHEFIPQTSQRRKFVNSSAHNVQNSKSNPHIYFQQIQNFERTEKKSYSVFVFAIVHYSTPALYFAFSFLTRLLG